jgi:tetratricopeptide (TPR) repeat protein
MIKVSCRLQIHALDAASGWIHGHLAYLALAGVYWWHHTDFEKTEQLFLQASSVLNENDQQLVAHASTQYGFFLTTQARTEEAMRLLKRAYQLDPNYLVSMEFLGDCYLIQKDFKNALKYYNQAIKLYEGNLDPIYRYGWAQVAAGNFSAARDFLVFNQKYFTERDPRPAVYLAISTHKTGNTSGAKTIIDRLLQLREQKTEVFALSYYLAAFYSATGESEKMYSELERSIRERENDLIWMKVDPVFEAYRNQPRFIDLLKKVGYQ